MAAAAEATDFRVVNDSAAVLFAEPSLSASKVAVAAKGYPLELLVESDGWLKVRTMSGALLWVEKTAVTERKAAVTRAASTEVRASPDAQGTVVMILEQYVQVEVLEVRPDGWVKVKHRDGGSGYLRLAQVWGA